MCVCVAHGCYNWSTVFEYIVCGERNQTGKTKQEIDANEQKYFNFYNTEIKTSEGRQRKARPLMLAKNSNRADLFRL